MLWKTKQHGELMEASARMFAALPSKLLDSYQRHCVRQFGNFCKTSSKQEKLYAVNKHLEKMDDGVGIKSNFNLQDPTNKKTS